MTSQTKLIKCKKVTSRCMESKQLEVLRNQYSGWVCQRKSKSSCSVNMSEILSSWDIQKMSHVNCAIKSFSACIWNALKRLQTYSINTYLYCPSLHQNISLLVHSGNSTFHHLQYPSWPTAYVNSNHRELCNLNSTNMKYLLDIKQWQEQI